MGKINKITNIALIFTLVGVFFYSGASYASNLRVPFGSYSRLEKKAEQARQMKLIRKFPQTVELNIKDAALFVKELTHGRFELVESGKHKFSARFNVILEVEEVTTKKSWFLRWQLPYISSRETTENVKLAKRIAYRRVNSENRDKLERGIPEIELDPYGGDCYYLTSKEGDVDLDTYLREHNPSAEQILSIGNQIIDIFEALEKDEKGDPGIYFWDNYKESNYRVDLTSDPMNPRVIFVDIGIEGFSRHEPDARYHELLSAMLDHKHKLFDVDPDDKEIISFFRQHDNGLRPDKAFASGGTVKILEPREGILRLKTEITEAAYSREGVKLPIPKMTELLGQSFSPRKDI